MGDTPAPRGAGRFLAAKPRKEVDDELQFHLEQRIRDNLARGMDPAAARAAALERLGDLDAVRRDCTVLLEEERRAERRRDWLDDLRQDIGFGVRSALRTPVFSFLAVLTLALGIGANAAVFGVFKSVLLDALPYADADRLVRVHGRFLDGSNDRGALSAGTVSDLTQRQRSYTSTAAFASHVPDAVVGGADGPRVAKLAWVQPGLFRTLGISPALGRLFTDDDVTPDTARVVVLTHAAWQRLFGGDSGALGRELRINEIPRTVIGVLPRPFVGPMGEADFYFALDLGPTLRSPVSARGSHWLGLVARLRPEIPHELAERELAGIGEDLAREHPQDNGSVRLVSMPLRTAMVGDTRTPLLVLMASAGLVLLIACANLAGAMLSRGISRRKEFAVRVALGAGRGRLVRQLLTESTVLAVAGGAAGVGLAVLGLSLLRGIALPSLPPYADLTLDPGALIITALLALSAGLAFGLAPALAARRVDPQGTLRDASRAASESHRSRRLRGILVAGQIALCVSLLAGAGLLARSLWAMTATPLGFEPEDVLTATVTLPNRDYGTAEARIQFQNLLVERMGALPGASSVAIAGSVPTAVMSRMGIAVEGAAPPPDDAQPFVLYTTVSDAYFRTLRIPLRRGRTFDARDHVDAPQRVVISEGMARRYWPEGDAVGSRLRMGPDRNAPWIEVIGVVGDVRNDLARADAEPMAYASNRQIPWYNPILLVRTGRDPLTLVGAVGQELTALDPNLPLDRVMTLRAMLGEGLAGRRLPVMLISAFGALALLLASVGVYALFTSMAAAREQEFGIRVALGSSQSAIARLVLLQGGIWMLAGLLGGAAGVVLVTRLLRDLLYGVRPFDPIVLGVAVAVLLACGAIALLVPVRRATRVDPINVLR